MLKYIEFADKESTLSIKSEYTITSDEANEIKLVVNNIIDALRNGIIDNKTAYKYLKLVVPANLSFDDITIEIASNESFTNKRTITLFQNADMFKVFSNGSYRSIVRASDIVDSFIVQLDDFIYQDSDNFGRYWFSRNGAVVGGVKTFNILVNDIQKIEEARLTPLILLNADELNAVKSSSASTSRNFNERTYDDIQTPSAFVKVENANESLVEYCDSHDAELIDNDLVRITSDCITFDTPNQQNDSFLTAIKAEFDFMGYHLSVTRKSAILDNSITDVFLADNNFNANESKAAPLYAQMRLSQAEPLNERIALGVPDDNEAVVRSGNVIVVKNVKSSTSNFIKAQNTEMPINILANDVMKLTVPNLTVAPGSGRDFTLSYAVSAKLKNGQEADVTSASELNVRCIDTNLIACSKSDATIAIDSKISNGSYIIEFEYLGVKEYKKLTMQHVSKLSMSTSIPQVLSANASCQYSVHLQNASDNIDMTDDASTRLYAQPFGSASNGTLRLDSIPVTHTSLINAKTEYDGIVYYTPSIVKLQSNNIVKLKLAGDHTEANEYAISAHGVREDGSETDVTAATTFSLAIDSEDSISGSILTIGKNRALRTIIVNGEFTDEQSKVHRAQLPIFSTGFGFIGIGIQGLTDLTPDIAYDYKVAARYNDGTSKYVDANLSFNEELSAVTTGYASPTLKVTPKKTLRNKTFVISAEYSEPGFGEFEHDGASLTATIHGGFDAVLSGVIGLHYGTDAYFEEEFVSDSIKIESIEASDFKAPVLTTYTARRRTEITPALINSLNTTNSEYQFVDFTLNGATTTVPFSMLTPEKVYIDQGTYNVRLYDMLSSDMCRDNPYAAEKTNYEYETGRTHSAIRDAYVSSFIQTGDAFKYYGANIYEYDARNSVWVPISSRNNKLDEKISLSANVNYKLEFVPISNVESAVNAYATFSVHKNLTKNGVSPAVLAIENPTFGLGLQILDIVPKFKTSTGKEYVVRMNHYDFVGDRRGTYWITDDVPLQAAELVDVTVVFAFAEDA